MCSRSRPPCSTAAARPAACHRVEVATDLRQDWPRALAESGFNLGRPAAWLAEGILYALPPEAADLLLDRITPRPAGHGTPPETPLRGPRRANHRNRARPLRQHRLPRSDPSHVSSKILISFGQPVGGLERLGPCGVGSDLRCKILQPVLQLLHLLGSPSGPPFCGAWNVRTSSTPARVRHRTPTSASASPIHEGSR
ncbi:class I SAM-dependent methyltransferase [Nonomuraea antimicrobica]|uniref:class I SAM-dependent methyltransferase n=1 Tax=Nonomuraea antimicrobica TaxID=561173 RepID=UPI003CD079C4